PRRDRAPAGCGNPTGAPAAPAAAARSAPTASLASASRRPCPPDASQPPFGSWQLPPGFAAPAEVPSYLQCLLRRLANHLPRWPGSRHSASTGIGPLGTAPLDPPLAAAGDAPNASCASSFPSS